MPTPKPPQLDRQTAPGTALIHEADERLLATEARDVMHDPPAPWSLPRPPLSERIEPWCWEYARCEFLATATRLGVRRKAEG